MRKIPKSFFLLLCTFLLINQVASAQKWVTKKIEFQTLKGSWKAKGSGDIKTFDDKKLSFLGIDAHCYLKTVWSFDSDSTGTIQFEKSAICADTIIHFAFQLMESPGYGGPLYKMIAHFGNNITETIKMSSPDGEKNLVVAYNQPFLVAGSIDRSVWIDYTLKKQ